MFYRSIICDYEGNAGVLSAGATSSPVVITVISPSTPANNLPNVATVSAGPENNTQNNSAQVNVNVTSGIDIGGSVALSQIINKNLHGDFTLIANTNINSNQNDNYNDLVNMRYVDTDNNDNTFNSSSSLLQIDNNYTIIWAGLFWQGHICSPNADGTGNGAGGGCDLSNSSYSDYNNAIANNNLGRVMFRAPGGTYQTITASSINSVNNRRPSDLVYSSFADVTNIVANAGSGSYWVANIPLTEGQVGFGGNYGGWALVTVYEDPNATLQYKNVSVFKGYQRITTDNVPLSISGFNTPKSGPVTASMAFFAADGDPVVGGIISMQNTNNGFTPLSNSANPANNTLNSTITNFGTPTNPGLTRTYGIDADRFNVSSFMTNSQTSTNFLFSALVGNIDFFNINMFTFATDLTSPLVDNFQKKSYIIYRDGTRAPANSTTLIYPGSLLEYVITFTNTGDEIAEALEIFDDFDYDGLANALDLNHFDSNEIKLYHAANISPGNEINNPNCRYDAFDHRVSCSIASVDIGDTYTMRFVVKVTNHFGDSVKDKNATNTAYSKYRNPNTNAYVNLYTTPQGEEVGGKSNVHNSGVFTQYTPNDEHITVDAINKNYDYTGPNSDRNITTKIANKEFDIKLIHRNINKNQAPYDAYDTLPMHVLITLEANGMTTQPINNPSSTLFNNNDASILATDLLIPNAHRGESLKMAYIDWKRLLSPSDKCSNYANNQPSMKGLLPCFYNYSFVQEIMPLEDYSDLSVCYSDIDRDGITDENASNGYPCDPNAYNFDGTPATQITPSVYNHNFGCFQCITQSSNQNVFVQISTDDFAVKPDHFEFNSSHTSYPDLLRAGVDYNFSITAIDGQGNPTKDYNTSDKLTPTESKFYKTLNTSDTSEFPKDELDDENITIKYSTPFAIVDGETNASSYIKIRYKNVAIRNLGILDTFWASQTDRDDTPEDCNTTTNANNIPIETGRNICSDDTKVRFIPHHFTVTAGLR